MTKYIVVECRYDFNSDAEIEIPVYSTECRNDAFDYAERESFFASMCSGDPDLAPRYRVIE